MVCAFFGGCSKLFSKQKYRSGWEYAASLFSRSWLKVDPRMFTGLVEFLGTVVSVESGPVGATLVVDCGQLAENVALGGSVAINGTCLTAVTMNGSHVSFQVGPETLKRTNLGQIYPGNRVNVERPLRMGAELGGHWVQGHVDAVGLLIARERSEEWDLVHFGAPTDLLRMMVPQGSITVDGVSLTVVNVLEDGFQVMLIPHTLAVTTLGLKKPGDPVNLETDILARYLWKALDHLIPIHLRQSAEPNAKP
jgi:riboflavin synthase